MKLKLTLFRRRELWWPTWIGWSCVMAILLIPGVLWCLVGESFLSLNLPEPDASVLVVEAWIGLEGLKAAKAEFETGEYYRIISVGGSTTGGWSEEKSNHGEMGRWELLRLGVPEDQVLAAMSSETDVHRTFHSALAVSEKLVECGLTPKAVNVFTRHIHSRRSNLVFRKVLPRSMKVGCISWVPEEERIRPFWKSTERSEDLVDETIGYFFELLANSGRH